MVNKLILLVLSLLGHLPTPIGQEVHFNVITASGKSKPFSLFIDQDESVQDVKTKIAEKLVKLSHGSLKEDTHFILVYHEKTLEEESNTLKPAMEKNAQQKLSSLSHETIAIIAFET